MKQKLMSVHHLRVRTAGRVTMKSTDTHVTVTSTSWAISARSPNVMYAHIFLGSCLLNKYLAIKLKLHSTGSLGFNFKFLKISKL